MKNILIIEDDDFLRSLMSKKLSSEGFNPISAIDGEDGLKRAEEDKPDLILLDLILPGIDGFGVLSKLKENKNTSSIPTVILSNLSQKEDIEKGLKIGAVDYIIKAQSTPEEIAEKVKSILK